MQQAALFGYQLYYSFNLSGISDEKINSNIYRAMHGSFLFSCIFWLNLLISMDDRKRILKQISKYCKKVHGVSFEKWAINQDRLVIIEFMMDWYISEKNKEIKYMYNFDRSMEMTEDQIEELRKAVEYNQKKYGPKLN